MFIVMKNSVRFPHTERNPAQIYRVESDWLSWWDFYFILYFFGLEDSPLYLVVNALPVG